MIDSIRIIAAPLLFILGGIFVINLFKSLDLLQAHEKYPFIDFSNVYRYGRYKEDKIKVVEAKISYEFLKKAFPPMIEAKRVGYRSYYMENIIDFVYTLPDGRDWSYQCVVGRYAVSLHRGVPVAIAVIDYAKRHGLPKYIVHKRKGVNNLDWASLITVYDCRDMDSDERISKLLGTKSKSAKA